MAKFIVGKNSNTEFLVEAGNAQEAVEQVQSGKNSSSIRHSENYQVREAPATAARPVPIAARVPGKPGPTPTPATG